MPTHSARELQELNNLCANVVQGHPASEVDPERQPNLLDQLIALRRRRISALYRLKNLRLVDEPGFQRLKTEEDGGAGKTIADFLLAPETKLDESARDDFRRRFLGLALEAYRRNDITQRKLAELASMVDIQPNEVRSVLRSVGLD